MGRRVGIYPGTFDPVHNGHIAFCDAALQECGLDEIIILPEHSPRDKSDVTLLEHRVALLQLATKNHPNISIRILASEQFSVQKTLPEIKTVCGEAEISLLVGSDVAYSLPGWSGISELLRETFLIVGLRQDDQIEVVRKMLDTLGDQKNVPVQYQLIKTASFGTASSSIRRGVASKDLDPSVADYIQANALY